MRVLSLIHQDDARSGVFAEAARAAGHELEEASLALRRAPSEPIETYDALMVMGGDMNVDQDREHPWLRDERELIAAALERATPLLGVCLGSQLVAQVAGAPVGPLAGGPEIGWSEVELEPAATADPLLGAAPPRFDALEWHSYGFREPPPDGVLLARSTAGPQAFRIDGRPAWGIQFHAEVDGSTLTSWLDEYGDEARAAGVDPVAFKERTRREIGGWNEFGRALCTRFLRAAAGN